MDNKTIIKAKKDLHNGGLCFTKGKQYEIIGWPIHNQSDLIDAKVTNDMGQPHIIGMWWKSFKIVK